MYLPTRLNIFAVHYQNYSGHYKWDWVRYLNIVAFALCTNNRRTSSLKNVLENCLKVQINIIRVILSIFGHLINGILYQFSKFVYQTLLFWKKNYFVYIGWPIAVNLSVINNKLKLIKYKLQNELIFHYGSLSVWPTRNESFNLLFY